MLVVVVIRIGSWLNSQRQRYKKGKLSQDRIDKLEAISNFYWDPFEAAWEYSFERLVKYIDRHGTADVSSNHIEQDGFKLGQWVHVQRSVRNKISSDRKERLERLKDWIWIKA